MTPSLPSFCKPLALALFLAGLLPLSAQAHRSWLLPSSTLIDSKEPWVTVDAAVSENLFDVDTVGIKFDGLSITDPEGAAIKPENQFVGKQRSTLDIKLAKPGTYKISLVTASVMASYKLGGETKRWRGTEETLKTEVPANAEDLKISRSYARQDTFVTAGKPNTKALAPTGKGLELEPITHPNDLRAGEQAKLRLLLDGKPAANLPFSLIPGGVRYRGVLGEIRLATDAKGEVAFTLPEAGMYWLNASYPLRAAPAPGAAPQGAGPGAGEAPGRAPGQGGGEQPALRLSYSATLEILPQ